MTLSGWVTRLFELRAHHEESYRVASNKLNVQYVSDVRFYDCYSSHAITCSSFCLI